MMQREGSWQDRIVVDERGTPCLVAEPTWSVAEILHYLAEDQIHPKDFPPKYAPQLEEEDVLACLHYAADALPCPFGWRGQEEKRAAALEKYGNLSQRAPK